MKIINYTKNTIFMEDIDFYLPYDDGKEVKIDSQMLKKSRQLRSYIVNCPEIKISEIDDNQQIEISLRYLKQKQNEQQKVVSLSKEHKKEPDLPEATSLCKSEHEIEVKIHGIFYDAGGYGKVNRNLALKLKDAGIKVKVSAKRSSNQLGEEELRPIVEMEKVQLSKHFISIDSIIPSFSELSGGRYRILYTTIESYSVPKQFLECCQQYNEIWLTSEWSASILKKHVNKPIYVVPTGVDHDLYKEEGPKFNFKPNIKDFVFLSVFGWSYRKGYDVLLKSYFEEFSGEDNVSLLLVTRYQSGITQHHKNKVRDDINKIIELYPNKNIPHITRYGLIVPEQDMPMLYRAANCFVLCSRGEGGGLPPLEASLCGLPIIMTNCSGQQQYLRKDNSYMIDIDQITEMQPGQMHLHYWDGQQFPALTSSGVIKQTRRHMRQVYENYQEAIKKNRNLQRLVLEKFTWNSTANAAIKRLKKWKTY